MGQVLEAKAESFMKVAGDFKGYEPIYRGLSIENM